MGKRTYTYDGSEWVGLTSTTADLSNYANMTTTPISGFRNAIINGDFRINQRGFTSTTSNAVYGFDRWQFQTSNGTCTYSSVTPSAGNEIPDYEPVSHARVVTSGQTLASAYTVILQHIEDVRSFAGQTVTVSFWAKSGSSNPKIAVEFQQGFGTGGSPSALVNTYVNQFTISTGWQRYSATVNLPSIAGKTIGTNPNTSSLSLILWISCGSDFNSRTNSLGIQSNTFDIWGVQVEKGSIPTPFEQRPIGTEISLCQRYFQKSFPITTTPVSPAGTGDGSGNNLTVFNTTVGNAYSSLTRFQTTMRRQPDITLFNAETSTNGTWSIYNSSGQINNSYAIAAGSYHNGIMFNAVSVPTVTVANGAWTANAEF
jgi:hypothetical protein